jgi:hypothetical protein
MNFLSVVMVTRWDLGSKCVLGSVGKSCHRMARNKSGINLFPNTPNGYIGAFTCSKAGRSGVNLKFR